MPTRSKTRAFVLLSVMMVVLILGMLLRVALVRMPTAAGLSRQTVLEQHARRAAQSGIAIALTKLREDNRWPRDTTPLSIDLPGRLRVVEQDGNVLGTLTDPDGTVSEFRIRFNYQNGHPTEDPDGFPDPPDDLTFDTPYVSVNNLDSTETAIVPRGEGDSFAVKEPEKGHIIPEVSVSLAVEGRALGSRGQVLARHVTEAVYLLSMEDTVDDAVVMAGGGLNIQLQKNGKVTLGAKKTDKATPGLARLRSKQELNAKAGHQPANLGLQQGRKAEFSYNPSTQSNIKEVSAPADRVTFVEERASKDFYSLPSDSIRKARPGAQTAQLPAGTYVYRRNGTSNGLTYYPVEYDAYQTMTPAERESTGPVEVRNDFSNIRKENLQFDSKQLNWKSATFAAGGTETNGLVLTVKDVDIKVVPQDNAKGIALIPETPVPFSDDNHFPVDKQAATPDRLLVNLTNTTLSSEGDLTIYGGIAGKSATLTSDQNVKLLAGRKLSLVQGADQEEPEYDHEVGGGEDGNQDEEARKDRNAALQLNIYAEGDLEISTYSALVRQGKGGYRPLTFKGLLYSWGNTSIHTASADPENKIGAPFTLKGSMVAYGNDPALGLPGAGSGGTSSGEVNIRSNNAFLHWDPSFFNLTAVEGGSRQMGFQQYSVAFPPP